MLFNPLQNNQIYFFKYKFERLHRSFYAWLTKDNQKCEIIFYIFLLFLSLSSGTLFIRITSALLYKLCFALCYTVQICTEKTDLYPEF